MLHVVFSETGAESLRAGLAALGRTDDRVVAFPDDLSFGPITPPGPALRARWIEQELGDDGWAEIVPQVEAFWHEVLVEGRRHLVWFSRRDVREHLAFLEYLRRIGDRPCEVIDLTDATILRRNQRGEMKPSPHVHDLGLLDASDIVENDLFALALPLADEVRARYQADWARLQQENAPVRIVRPDLTLASVALDYFDAELLAQVQTRFQKAARVIGAVLAQYWDADIFNLGDFFLSRRLMALVRTGIIEAQGDLTRIFSSEVRLPRSRSSAEVST